MIDPELPVIVILTRSDPPGGPWLVTNEDGVALGFLTDQAGWIAAQMEDGRRSGLFLAERKQSRLVLKAIMAGQPNRAYLQ